MLPPLSLTDMARLPTDKSFILLVLEFIQLSRPLQNRIMINGLILAQTIGEPCLSLQTVILASIGHLKSPIPMIELLQTIQALALETITTAETQTLTPTALGAILQTPKLDGTIAISPMMCYHQIITLIY